MKLARYVELERGNRESVERMMATCEGLLAEGVPVYPIVVRGTGEALPKKGMVLRRHIRATVEVLDPLDPNDFATLEELKDETKSIFEKELATTPILP